MSDTFDPGLGWREVMVDESRSAESVRYASRDTMRYWVREAPVPPLPTEPYTVIRVTWSATVGAYSPSILTLVDGLWSGADPRNVQQKITGFEVLAVPVVDDARLLGERERTRRETAKAVLERVLETTGLGADYERIAREFGVEQ